jgi:hypothetical protein
MRPPVAPPRDNRQRAGGDVKWEWVLTLRAARFMSDNDARKLKSLSVLDGRVSRNGQIFLRRALSRQVLAKSLPI